MTLIVDRHFLLIGNVLRLKMIANHLFEISHFEFELCRRDYVEIERTKSEKENDLIGLEGLSCFDFKAPYFNPKKSFGMLIESN